MIDAHIAAKAHAHRHLGRNTVDHALDRFRQRVLGECPETVGPVPKLDGETFTCIRGRHHPLPHKSDDGTWWEPPPPPVRPRDSRGRFTTRRQG
jgi:hypothetical protein